MVAKKNMGSKAHTSAIGSYTGAACGKTKYLSAAPLVAIFAVSAVGTADCWCKLVREAKGYEGISGSPSSCTYHLQRERSLASWNVFGALGAGVLIAAQTWSGV